MTPGAAALRDESGARVGFMSKGSDDFRVIEGRLEDYWEPHTEGTCWAVFEDDRSKGPYDRLHLLESGDRLSILDEHGGETFTVTIDPDFDAGRTTITSAGGGRSVVRALGRDVHWTQKGWDPDDWARLFIPSPPADLFEARLRVELADAGREEWMEEFYPQGRLSLSHTGECQEFLEVYERVFDSFRLRARLERAGAS